MVRQILSRGGGRGGIAIPPRLSAGPGNGDISVWGMHRKGDCEGRGIAILEGWRFVLHLRTFVKPERCKAKTFQSGRPLILLFAAISY